MSQGQSSHFSREQCNQVTSAQQEPNAISYEHPKMAYVINSTAVNLW